MTAGHLVAFGDLSLLDDVDTDDFVDSWREWIFVLSGEDADFVDDTSATVWDTEGGVFAFLGLLGEDRHKELFLWGRLGLSFWSDLTNEDVAFLNFGAFDDDAAFV